MLDMLDPLCDVMAERQHQDEIRGSQEHDDLYWYAVLSKEVGEVASALTEKTEAEQYQEIVQVAAVALAWLEHMSKRGTI